MGSAKVLMLVVSSPSFLLCHHWVPVGKPQSPLQSPWSKAGVAPKKQPMMLGEQEVRPGLLSHWENRGLGVEPSM